MFTQDCNTMFVVSLRFDRAGWGSTYNSWLRDKMSWQPWRPLFHCGISICATFFWGHLIWHATSSAWKTSAGGFKLNLKKWQPFKPDGSPRLFRWFSHIPWSNKYAKCIPTENWNQANVHTFTIEFKMLGALKQSPLVLKGTSIGGALITEASSKLPNGTWDLFLKAKIGTSTVTSFPFQMFYASSSC